MLDVLTVGTATRDTFLQSPLFKVLRDPKHLERIGFKTGEAECFALGSKIEIEQPVVTVGGGAANAAVAFARQGFKTAALVRIGDDEGGKAIVAALKREKVQPLAIVDRNLGTARSNILLTPGGERTILVYRGAAGGMKPNEVPIRKLAARWAYIAPGDIPYSIIREMVATLKKRGASIAMNPSREYLSLGSDRTRELFAMLDVVTVDREEASYLTGAPYKNDTAIFKKLDQLVRGIAVMTDGARGAKASDGKYVYTAGVFKEKRLVDRTGAGDAFGAGFVAGLMQKHDISYALRLASANAASVVEAIGAETAILTKKQFSEKRWRYLDLDVEPC
jgi:sugar/nucleoside kinase (ribokinase family)